MKFFISHFSFFLSNLKTINFQVFKKGRFNLGQKKFRSLSKRPIQPPLKRLFSWPLLILGLANFSLMGQIPSPGFGPAAGKRPGISQQLAQIITIKEIKIEGCKTVDEALVRTNFLLKEGKDYAPGKVSESINSLYGLGLFSDIQVFVDQSSEGLFVRIVVEEYELLDKLSFEGNKKLDEEELSEAVNLIEGQVLPPQTLDQAKNAVLEKYKEEGYLLADAVFEKTKNEENGKMTLVLKIDEGKKVQVEKIVFEGNEAFKSSKLKRKMKDIKEDRWWRSGDYHEDKFLADLDSIQKFYHRKGYLDARIESHSIEYSEDRTDIFLKVKIHEGIQYRLGKVAFIGNEIYKDTILKRAMEIEEGELMGLNLLLKSRFNMETLYREKGYLFVRFDEKRTYSDSIIDLTYQITEGGPAHIHKVVISGNIKTLEKVIRREIRTLPGEIYQQSKLQRSVRDIQMLQYFDDVQFDLENREDGGINLKFDVFPKETGTDQFTAGAGFSQRQGIVGNLGLTINNFSIRRPFLEGGGQLLRINFEEGRYRKNRDVTFQEPWFMDTGTLLGFRLFWTKNNYFQRDDAVQLRKGFEIRLGRRLNWPDNFFRIDGQYGLESENSGGVIYIGGITRISDTDPRILLSGLKSYFNITLSRNDLDLPMFPTRGSDYSYNLRLVGGPLGGDYKFLRHLVRVNWYFPLVWRFVLGSKNKFGTINKWPGKEFALSPYDPWLAGGVNYTGQIRGYREAAFGGGINSGKYLSTTTWEISFPVVERILYSNTFLDMGGTWGEAIDLDVNNMYTAVGTGVRVMVPMFGLLGFDVAYGFQALDDNLEYQRRTRVLDPWEFHFTIGQGF